MATTMVQRDRTRQRVLGSQLSFAVVDQGVAGVGFLLSLGDCPWSNPSSAATETPPTTSTTPGGGGLLSPLILLSPIC